MRWDIEKGKDVNAPDVDAFLADIVTVYRKHGMSLGHEDHHGAFEVYRTVIQDAIDWLMAAQISDRESV